MKVTILGAGKMGEALARGILAAGLLAPADLWLSDVATARVAELTAGLGATAATDNRQAVADATIVILAVKPNIIETVCREIADALPTGGTVLSIAAGITLCQLERYLHREDITLARAMPNTPCLVGAGAIGLSVNASAPESVRQALRALLAPLGLVEEMPEKLLNAVTGLSGSGPAYVAVLVEALADGAVRMGLPRDAALRLAAQTVMGTGKLLLETRQHPAQVKDAVSSPGGTTIAGVAALEANGFRHALITAVQAATVRARELSEE